MTRSTTLHCGSMKQNGRTHFLGKSHEHEHMLRPFLWQAHRLLPTTTQDLTPGFPEEEDTEEDTEEDKAGGEG